MCFNRIGVTTLILILILPGLIFATSHSARIELERVSLSSSQIILQGYVPEIPLENYTYSPEYKRIRVYGIPYIRIEGAPELPVVRELLLLPPSANINLQVLEYDSLTMKHLNILPNFPPQEEGTSGNVYQPQPDEKIYTSNSYYPPVKYQIEELGILRGHKVVVVNYFPIRYNPVEQSLRIVTRFQLTISMDKVIDFRHDWLRQRMFLPFYNRLFLNVKRPDFPLGKGTGFVPPYNFSGADYLIITTYRFKQAADTLSWWRRMNGLTTEIAFVEDIGSSPEAIRGFIQEAYFQWDIPPSYLLLLGDTEDLPVFYRTEHPREDNGLIGTDLYYAAVDGDDYLPDLNLGRISVDTPLEALSFVESAINYERAPPWEDEFYQRIALTAYFQDDDDPDTPDVNERDGYSDRRFIRTSEELRDFFLSKGYEAQRIYYAKPEVNPLYYNDGPYGNGEPLPSDLLRENGFAWDGNSSRIKEAVEEGVFLLVHRDHGNRSGWVWPSFNVGNVQELQNGPRIPLVLSIECKAGWFDNEIDDPALSTGATAECFAEAWLRNFLGSALGIVASTRVSYSGYNDDLTKGMVDAIWEDFLDFGESHPGNPIALGEMLNYGKYYMLVQNYGGSRLKIEFEEFHLLGDPAAIVRTRPPEPLSVVHDSIFYLNQQYLNVHTDIPACQITILQKGEVIYSGLMDQPGDFSLPVEVLYPESPLIITAVKPGYLPYTSRIPVLPAPEPNLSLRVDGFKDQNLDGVLNPGEKVYPLIDLSNTGNSSLQHISLSLSLSDSSGVVEDSVVQIPALETGDSLQISSLSFILNPYLKNWQKVDLNFQVSYQEKQQTFNLEFPVFQADPVMEVHPDFIYQRIDTSRLVSDSLVIINRGFGELQYNVTGELLKLYDLSEDSSDQWVSFPAGIGNIITPLKEENLIRFAQYVQVIEPGKFYFFVYEGAKYQGDYHLMILDSTVVSSTGRYFLWSNELNLTLSSEKYYFLGICWQGGITGVCKSLREAPIDLGDLTVESGCLLDVSFPPVSEVEQRLNRIIPFIQSYQLGEGDWVSGMNEKGRLFPGESDTVFFQLKPSGQDTLFQTNLIVTANSPVEDTIIVPLYMQVGDIGDKLVCHLEKEKEGDRSIFHPGETSKLKLRVVNAGTQLQKGLRFSLSSVSDYVLLLDSVSVRDTLLPGHEITLTDFEVQVLPDAPDGGMVTLRLQIENSEGAVIYNGKFKWLVKTGAPELDIPFSRIELWSEDDSSDTVYYPLLVANRGYGDLTCRIENTVQQEKKVGTVMEDGWFVLGNGAGNLIYQLYQEDVLSTSFYLNIQDTTLIYFFIYQATSFPDTFSLLGVDSLLVSEAGRRWCSFQLPYQLLPGRYYYIGLSWKGQAGVARAVETIPFQTDKGQVFSSVFNQGGTPPDSFLILDQKRYYPIAFRLRCGKDDWLETEVNELLIEPGSSDTVNLLINPAEEGKTYSGTIHFIDNSNERDRKTVQVIYHAFPRPEQAVLPDNFSLLNYPNPFNDRTLIDIGLKASGLVRIEIYDIRGRLVRKLYSGEMDAGYYHLTWDGRDRSGRRVSTGIYLLCVRMGQRLFSHKMLLIK